MLLNPAFRYVSLDFETTGLDSKKDEIIQIGLAALDTSGKVIDTFHTYIKPSSSQPLATIVQYITGIQEKDIQNAPRLEDIYDAFSKFFDDKTIIIGHNIEFDIAFLQKFFPDITYLGHIDTYTRSQNFIHFVPSFSLEVLFPLLYQEQESFIQITKDCAIMVEEENFHDALYDAKTAAALYLYIVQHIQRIVDTYPQAHYIFSKSPGGLFRDSIQMTIVSPQDKKTIYTLPLLHRSISNPQMMVKKKDTIQLQSLTDKSHHYIGNTTVKNIAHIIGQHKQSICVFSHKSKADIVKNILHSAGVYGIGSLYNDHFFNNKRFTILLQKPTFTQEEQSFLFKYLSHHMQGLGMLDIQQDHEYRIIYFLQESKKPSKNPLVFATHETLYRHIQSNPDFYKEYSIYFFDQDWRYMTHNNFLSRSYDPYYYIQMVEKLIYTYDTCQQVYPDIYREKYDAVEQLYSLIQVFVGVWNMDSQKVFEDYGGVSIQLDPILYHQGFYRTQKMRQRLEKTIEKVATILPEDVVEDINEHQQKVHRLLTNIITIQKRSNPEYGYNFVYKQSQIYTQWEDFLELFDDKRTLFFSNHDNKKPLLLADEKKSTTIFTQLTPDNLLNTVQAAIKQHNIIYIVSTQKQTSQTVFDTLCQYGIHQSATIVAENITGGSGKNIFLAKKSEKVIMIGGYSFYLQALAKDISIDKMMIFFIKGSIQSLLLADMERYATE